MIFIVEFQLMPRKAFALAVYIEWCLFHVNGIYSTFIRERG